MLLVYFMFNHTWRYLIDGHIFGMQHPEAAGEPMVSHMGSHELTAGLSKRLFGHPSGTEIPKSWWRRPSPQHLVDGMRVNGERVNSA